MKERLITLRLTEKSYNELSKEDAELVASARAATDGSYAPYSNFHVGAAIRLDDGTIVTGANQENAAFLLEYAQSAQRHSTPVQNT